MGAGMRKAGENPVTLGGSASAKKLRSSAPKSALCCMRMSADFVAKAGHWRQVPPRR